MEPGQVEVQGDEGLEMGGIPIVWVWDASSRALEAAPLMSSPV